MPRLFIGSVLGGLAMWLVGFIFWGTPLSLLAFRQTSATGSLELQAALAQQLGATGTGTYWIPAAGSTTGTELIGRGPNALVHFINSGIALPDSGALLGGLILAIVCTLLVGIALRTCAPRATFGGRLKLVLLFAVAVTAYSDLGQPIFNHMPWGYHFYLWIAELLSWAAAGAVLAWFLPRPHAVLDGGEALAPDVRGPEPVRED